MGTTDLTAERLYQGALASIPTDRYLFGKYCRGIRLAFSLASLRRRSMSSSALDRYQLTALQSAETALSVPLLLICKAAAYSAAVITGRRVATAVMFQIALSVWPKEGLAVIFLGEFYQAEPFVSPHYLPNGVVVGDRPSSLMPGPPQQCWRIVSYSGAPAAIISPLNRSGASTVGEWFRMGFFMVVVNVQCPKAVWSSVAATSYLPSQAIRSKSKGQPDKP